MFGYEEHNQGISIYEELIFWVLLVLQSRLQTTYQQLSSDLLNLKGLLQQNQPKLFAHFDKLNIQYELMFATALQSLGASLLSTPLFLRVLDQQFMDLS